MDRYQRGDLLPALWQPAGASQAVNVNVKGWNFGDSVATFDVTGTRHLGRGTARIAGKGDAKGSCELHVDADLPPYGATLNIQKGLGGVLFFAVDAQGGPAYISQPVILKEVHYNSSVDQDEVFTFDYEENILAGVKVYPNHV